MGADFEGGTGADMIEAAENQDSKSVDEQVRELRSLIADLADRVGALETKGGV